MSRVKRHRFWGVSFTTERTGGGFILTTFSDGATHAHKWIEAEAVAFTCGYIQGQLGAPPAVQELPDNVLGFPVADDTP